MRRTVHIHQITAGYLSALAFSSETTSDIRSRTEGKSGDGPMITALNC